ncbi:MAG: hypothetical protein AAB364_01395 [Patescibacteria group bacterium]|mgnify:FL=1
MAATEAINELNQLEKEFGAARQEFLKKQRIAIKKVVESGGHVHLLVGSGVEKLAWGWWERLGCRDGRDPVHVTTVGEHYNLPEDHVKILFDDLNIFS